MSSRQEAGADGSRLLKPRFELQSTKYKVQSTKYKVLILIYGFRGFRKN